MEFTCKITHISATIYPRFHTPLLTKLVPKFKSRKSSVIVLDGWPRMGLLTPREFRRHILSCRELKTESFKKCLHSVRWGVSL